MRSLSLPALFCLLLAGLLGACATTTPRDPGPVVTAPVEAPPTAAPGDAKPLPKPASPPPSPMSTEQRFLDDWFRGTPVVIAAQGPAGLTVDVPLANSFEAGKSEVRPALNAVLERVAQSLRRQIGARVAISAPADAGGAPGLAAARAQRVREALIAKNVAAPRISLAEAARPGAAVQLRVSLPPPPIARLKDSSLVVPAAGVKPTATQPPR
jgi:outer membrane protein OmpA-like peptidoglycan-associated protein